MDVMLFLILIGILVFFVSLIWLSSPRRSGSGDSGFSFFDGGSWGDSGGDCGGGDSGGGDGGGCGGGE